MTMRPGDVLRLSLAPILTVGVAVGVLMRGAFPYGDASMPMVTIDGQERPEGCLRCHGDIRGLGAAHDPSAMGCSACHLGDATALDERGAHEGMHTIAGNLAIAPRTCGQQGCHPSEATRVDRSIMAGAPGLLAVNRFTFGERDTPRTEPSDDLRRLDPASAPSSPAESHVRKLCASCHIGNPKTEVGDQGFASRGGGCTACHLNSPSLTDKQQKGRLHPDVTAAVKESRCEGCHARSGRIALSFHGKVELEPTDPRVNGKLPDGRPIGTTSPDVHAKAGFSCVDCHTERGLMGDGRVVGHGFEAVDVRCEDCHQPDKVVPSTPADAARVAEVLRASWRNRGGPNIEGEPYRTQRGTPMWRTDRQSGRQWLHETGEAVEVIAAKEAPYHRLLGHERLSCQACHTPWAPRCGSCHTQFEKNESQFDHIANAETPGAWHETAGKNGFGPPLLAVGPRGRIYPFVEGMTLTIEGIEKPVKRMLWAPLDPHTTAESRVCASCHLEELETVYPSAGETTRVGARLVSNEERERIRRVGSCVACHSKYEDAVFVDFRRSLERLRGREKASATDAVRSCEGRVTE